MNFCELYCDRFQCSPMEFDDDVFWRCLHPRARLWAHLIRMVNRNYFATDIELIESVGDLTDLDQMDSEVMLFRYHRPAKGFWRGKMRVRISGRRLLGLAKDLFTKTHPAKAPLQIESYHSFA